MNQYKIDATYTRLNADGNTVTRTMYFVTSANSLEEARSLTEEIAATYINKINGSLISMN